MPPTRRKSPVTARDEKRRALHLLEKNKDFPPKGWELVRYMGVCTLREPSFHTTQAEISRRIFDDPLPDEIFETRHKRRVDALFEQTRAALKESELRPESKISPYRICLDEGNRKKGLRLSFKRRPSRTPKTVSIPNDHSARLLWRRMIEAIDAETVLVIYDTPEIGLADSSHEWRGLWAGSGEVVAAFLLGRCLAGIEKQLHVKRWRDMDHADLTGPGQCLIILGSSLVNPWLQRLRSRERWVDLQAFHFETGRSDDSRGCICKAPLRSVKAGKELVYEHRQAAEGVNETDYALISCFHDTAYKQTLIALQGITSAGTHGAAAFMCGDDYVEELHGFLRARHNCDLKERSRSFEAVLELHVNHGRPLDMDLVDAVVYDTPVSPSPGD